MRTNNAPTNTCLSFLGVHINLRHTDSAVVEPTLNFFSSHFNISTGSAQPEATYTIAIHSHKECASLQFNKGSHDDVWIRKSASEYFSHPARRYTDKEIQHVVSLKSGAIFRFDGSSNTIDLYLGEGDITLELIELIRDLVHKKSENNGVLVLHSACVEKHGQAVLIIGKKGAGKTTTAIHLATHRGYKLVSGDKVFITQNTKQLSVVGWPDYPNLGIGTLRSHQELWPALGIESDAISPLSNSDKIPIDPALFRGSIDHADGLAAYAIARIIYPNVLADASRVAEPDMSAIDFLRMNIEPAYGKHSDWYTLTKRASADVSGLLKAVSCIPSVTTSGTNVSHPSGVVE